MNAIVIIRPLKKLIFLIICITAFQGNAQSIDSLKSYDISKRFFIEPLSLVDGYNAASLRLGVEWPLFKDFCSIFGVYGAYPFSQSAYGEYFKAGIKFYSGTLFSKSAIKKSACISLQCFYKAQRFSVNDNLEDANAKAGQAVVYSVTKNVKGLNIELGKSYAYKHFCLEPYFGLGIRMSTVSNSLSDSLFNKLYDVEEGYATRIGNSAKYNALSPSLILGLRLCYLFKTNRGKNTSGTYSSFLLKRLN